MRFSKITNLVFILCLAACLRGGVETFAQPSNDLFTSLAGVSNATRK